jgi:hypothetical protein
VIDERDRVFRGGWVEDAKEDIVDAVKKVIVGDTNSIALIEVPLDDGGVLLVPSNRINWTKIEKEYKDVEESKE